jgi:hypothetical protein
MWLKYQVLILLLILMFAVSAKDDIDHPDGAIRLNGTSANCQPDSSQASTEILPEAFWNGFEGFVLMSGMLLKDAFPIYCTALKVARVPLDKPLDPNYTGVSYSDYEWVPMTSVQFIPDTDVQSLGSWFQYNDYDYWTAFDSVNQHRLHIRGVTGSAIGDLSAAEKEACCLVLYFNEVELYTHGNYTYKHGGNNTGKELLLTELPTYFDSKIYHGAFKLLADVVSLDHLSFGTEVMYNAYNNVGLGSLRLNGVVVTRSSLVEGLGDVPMYHPLKNAKYPDFYSIWLFSGRKPLIMDLEAMAFVGFVEE